MSRSKEERSRSTESDDELQPDVGESGAESDTAEQSVADEQSESGETLEPESEENSAESLGAEIAELKEQLLRKQADFENFRKRMNREREESIKYANSKLLLDLVEIIDNFDRAIKSSEESQDFASFHAGIELIERQFTSMLESKWGLKRIESTGAEFDPEKHEAISAEEREDTDIEIVIEDYQRGYMLHDRVLRHAKVKVALPASGASGDSKESSDTNETDS